MHRNVCRGGDGAVNPGQVAYHNNSQSMCRNPMRPKALVVCGIGLLIALSCEGQAIRQNTHAIVRRAWVAWENGNVRDAENLARGLAERAEGARQHSCPPEEIWKRGGLIYKRCVRESLCALFLCPSDR